MFRRSEIAVIFNCFKIWKILMYLTVLSLVWTLRNYWYKLNYLPDAINIWNYCKHYLYLCLQKFCSDNLYKDFLKSTQIMMSKYYGTSFTKKCINVLNCIESCLDSQKLLLFLTVLTFEKYWLFNCFESFLDTQKLLIII